MFYAGFAILKLNVATSKLDVATSNFNINTHYKTFTLSTLALRSENVLHRNTTYVQPSES